MTIWLIKFYTIRNDVPEQNNINNNYQNEQEIEDNFQQDLHNYVFNHEILL